jgi:predicted HAD superfamily Cof-like phosphohydrolase
LVFDPAEVDQMQKLLSEEVGELNSAIDRGDLLKIVDGLADVVYVAYGMALQYGVDLDRAISAVHRSNMTKVDLAGPWSTGRPRKVARGDDYLPPDLDDAIGGRSGD